MCPAPAGCVNRWCICIVEAWRRDDPQPETELKNLISANFLNTWIVVGRFQHRHSLGGRPCLTFKTFYQ